MKERYEIPEMEIILFSVESVVTASGLIDEGDSDKDDEVNAGDLW